MDWYQEWRIEVVQLRSKRSSPVLHAFNHWIGFSCQLLNRFELLVDFEFLELYPDKIFPALLKNVLAINIQRPLISRMTEHNVNPTNSYFLGLSYREKVLSVSFILVAPHNTFSYAATQGSSVTLPGRSRQKEN